MPSGTPGQVRTVFETADKATKSFFSNSTATPNRCFLKVQPFTEGTGSQTCSSTVWMAGTLFDISPSTISALFTSEQRGRARE